MRTEELKHYAGMAKGKLTITITIKIRIRKIIVVIITAFVHPNETP